MFVDFYWYTNSILVEFIIIEWGRDVNKSSSEDNLWSILYLTGYLTMVPDKRLSNTLPSATSALMIPNTEIREIYESTIIQWVRDSAQTWNRESLFQAAWNGDITTLTAEMNQLLRKTISYHDYPDSFLSWTYFEIFVPLLICGSMLSFGMPIPGQNEKFFCIGNLQ